MAFMGQLVQWEDQLKGNIKPSKPLSDKENNAIKDIGKPRWEWPAREAQTLP